MSARVRASAVAVSASRGTSACSSSKRSQLPIVGAEIVAPFADAMRFVDRDQRQRNAADQPAESFAGRALGRDIEQVELARPEALDGRSRSASAEVSEAARMPIASAARIWSCISAIRGEMTSAVPGRASAGS